MKSWGLLFTATIFPITSSMSIADTVRSNVVDHYRDTVIEHPYTTHECRNVQVPVYGRSQGNAGDALIGAIIGGAIGNQFGSGSGKDAMTVLGAIAGVESSKNGQKIVGYREERQCSEVIQYKSDTVREYSHSTVTFFYNGNTYTVDFVK